MQSVCGFVIVFKKKSQHDVPKPPLMMMIIIIRKLEPSDPTDFIYYLIHSQDLRRDLDCCYRINIIL